MSVFRVGQKVAKFRYFVPERFRGERVVKINVHPLNEPVTVIGIQTDPHFGVECLLIAEYPNYCPRRMADIGWFAGNFRPVVSRTQEQDVQMILSLLTPSVVEA